ncbi:MAG TPA: hypothetical protein VGM37_15975 [Armatimonadota bacterium]|jgi:hypothetical protein
MNTKTQITCQCGQRIHQKDILQKGHFLRLFSPSFVYLKYRCSRCRRLGERFVPQEQWDDGALAEVPVEISPEERDRLGALGGIDLDEVIDFHFQLEQASLRDLMDPQDDLV